MLLGLATAAAISGTPVGNAPMLAQWMSFTPGRYSPITYRPCPAGVVPLVFLESGMGEVGYRCILTGAHDDQLRAVRAQLPPDARPRFDHEPTGPKNEWRIWGSMDPPLYVDVFQHVAGILGPLVWTMVAGPSHYDRWAAYWPGAEHVGWMGFDQFDNGKRVLLPRAWKRPIAECREIDPDVPIMVPEWASLRRQQLADGTWRELPAGREKHLRSVLDVEGVEAASYFNVDYGAITGKPTNPDWTMTPRMAADFAGMVA